ncbi:hypothetical protein CAEBREN_09477 [Caenorhabditis brenneri]|uniref:Uncharacterized protein n=1 Tax=Caenorhabditis brenneri TaxID=135651 RepID=G0NDK1_CAEBE|nr:hypothetical protein CAEBREN_09477 [Caenorhabditis brenneri]
MPIFELIIPHLGSQKFVLKNKDTKERQIVVDLFSTRFVIVEEKNGENSKLTMTVAPKQDYFFEIKDKGPPENKEYHQLEGILQIMVSEDQQESEITTYDFLPRRFLVTDPKSDSYRKIRDAIEGVNPVDYGIPEGGELDKLIVLEPFPYVKPKTKTINWYTSNCDKRVLKKIRIQKTRTTTDSEEEKKEPNPSPKKAPSTTPEDSTNSTSEILPKPEKPIVPKKETKSVTGMTTLDEVTPPSKSLKLADVVFSDRPPKPSGETDKKSKISTSVEKEPPKEEKQVEKGKTRKLDDVVFTDKPKGPNVLTVKGPIRKSPMKEQGKKDKKTKKKKCVIS